MYNLVLRPFTKTDTFTDRLLALKKKSAVIISYVIGSPKKRSGPDPLHITLAGWRNEDAYTISILVKHYYGNNLFAFGVRIPDTEYDDNLADITRYLLDTCVTEDYLYPKIQKALVKKSAHMEMIPLNKILKGIHVAYQEPIAVFSPESREYKRLKAAAFILEAETGKSHIVQNCLYDMGQNWHWTTILGESGCKSFPRVQILNPKQQGLLVFGSMEQFNETVVQLIKKKK